MLKSQLAYSRDEYTKHMIFESTGGGVQDKFQALHESVTQGREISIHFIRFCYRARVKRAATGESRYSDWKMTAPYTRSMLLPIQRHIQESQDPMSKTIVPS